MIKLTIIIPVYNEIKTIEKLIKKILKINIKKQLIIVDDGSSDGTELILKKYKSRIDKLIFHKKNCGKGAAIKSGQKYVRGKYIGIQDADLEYDPNEYGLLIEPIINKIADVVYGSRVRGREVRRVLFFWHTMGNAFLTFFSNMMTNLNLTDTFTCYKAFNREILKNIEIKENRFGFDAEITAKLAKKKARIFEVGISYYGRTYEEGKKIGIKDGFRTIYCIIKYNLF